MDAGFDPVNSFNTHIALLVIIEEFKEELKWRKGLALRVGKAIGRELNAELVKSRESLRKNQMWIDETSIADGRYRCSIKGRRTEREVDKSDLETHKNMMMENLEIILKSAFTPPNKTNTPSE